MYSSSSLGSSSRTSRHSSTENIQKNTRSEGRDDVVVVVVRLVFGGVVEVVVVGYHRRETAEDQRYTAESTTTNTRSEGRDDALQHSIEKCSSSGPGSTSRRRSTENIETNRKTQQKTPEVKGATMRCNP